MRFTDSLITSLHLREAHPIPPRIGDSKRGRVKVLAVVAAFAVFMFGIDVALWIRTDQFHAITAFGRLAVIGGLGIFVFKGRDWARIVLGLWLGLMSISYVIGAAFSSDLGTLFGITMLVIAVAVAAGAVLLFSSGDIQQMVEDAAKANRAPGASSTGE